MSLHWREGDIVLGLYDVRGVVGSGRFGAVYRVYHLDWRKELAVKSPSEESLARAEYMARCLKGAGAWADLGVHPNIATCYYVREVGGFPRVFLEYVAGGSLRERLAKGLDLKQALDYAIQICLGMAHAHRHSIVHRDLKPENCLLTADDTLKVTDPGIGGGCWCDEAGRDCAGTPGYMAPEEWRPGAPGSPQADIFSFGVVLHEMVAGRAPFAMGEGETPGAFHARLLDSRWACEELAADVPPGLAALVADCLSEDPEERPDSFTRLEARLEEVYREVAGSSYPRRGVEEGSLQAANLNKKGVSLYDLGMKDESLRALEHAVKSDPSYLESSYNHTLLLWERGRMTDRDAIRWLEMKSESHAGEWRPLYFLGLAHIARKDAAAAESALREALRIVSVDGEVATALEEVARARDSWPRFLQTLEGHNGSVSCVAISRDGGCAVSGSDDKTLIKWDPVTGQRMGILKGHERAVTGAAISSDGGFAVSGSGDKCLRCWDLERGECIRILKGHERVVTSVAISPDGRLALSGSDDRTARCWDLSAGECVRVLKGHERAVTSIAISPDGRFALSGSADKTLRYWDLGTGECLRILNGHERGVSSAAISPDGRFALSGSEDKTLRRWDLVTAECLCVLNGHERAVTSVALCPDGRFAVSGSRDKTLRQWDAVTGTCLRTVDKHNRVINCVAVSPDGRSVLLGGDDKTVSLWYPGRQSVLRLPLTLGEFDRLEPRMLHAHDFSLLKDKAAERMQNRSWRGASEYLQRARSLPGYGRHPEIMDLRRELGVRGVRKAFNGAWLKCSLKGHEDWVNSVAISRDGEFALSASDDRTVRRWDLKACENVGILEGHEDRVSCVEVSPRGMFALSGGHDRSIRVWNLVTGQCLRVLEGHEDWVSCVAISPDGTFAVSGGDDRSLRLWDLWSGEELRTFEHLPGAARSVAISPDARFALSGGDDDVLSLWDLWTGELRHGFQGHQAWISSVALSPDWRYALSGSLDGTVRLWDVGAGVCLRVLSGHEDWVRCVAISPDGRFALSGGHDRTLRLWDLRTGESLRVFKGHEDWVSSAVFSPDGRYAISGSNDSALRLWEFDWAYSFPAELDWSEGAAPYLEAFLTLHTPCSAGGVMREGEPVWAEDDFTDLLNGLSLAGYGWIKPAGVRRKLTALAAAREGRDLSRVTEIVRREPGHDGADSLAAMHCVCCGRGFAAEILNAAAFCPECQRFVSRAPEEGEQASWWKRLMGR